LYVVQCPLALHHLILHNPRHTGPKEWATADLEQASGRLSVPYVMLYYLPVTTNAEMRMLYAGAKELMRNTAEVNKIIEIVEAEDLEDIEEKLKGDS
jgi:Cofilin/tropomyosin-type actin-binding protein